MSNVAPIASVLLIDQHRGGAAEIVHRQAIGRPSADAVDRHRIGRRQAFQLIGDDDGVVACRRGVAGFPVRPGAPQPVRRRAVSSWRSRPGRGVGAGDRDRDILRGARALRIRHGHRIGKREGFALGDEVAEPDRKVGKLPVDRSETGAGAVGRESTRSARCSKSPAESAAGESGRQPSSGPSACWSASRPKPYGYR